MTIKSIILSVAFSLPSCIHSIAFIPSGVAAPPIPKRFAEKLSVIYSSARSLSKRKRVACAAYHYRKRALRRDDDQHYQRRQYHNGKDCVHNKSTPIRNCMRVSNYLLQYKTFYICHLSICSGNKLVRFVVINIWSFRLSVARGEI